jgi:hypothetical protein
MSTMPSNDRASGADAPQGLNEGEILRKAGVFRDRDSTLRPDVSRVSRLQGERARGWESHATHALLERAPRSGVLPVSRVGENVTAGDNDKGETE